MGIKSIVIIPAYNEEKSIVKTVQDICEHAPEFDYVIINDCSTDQTLSVCRKHHLHVLNLPVNLGIGGAVQTGFLYAHKNGYDYAVQLDGDGQHDAQYLQEMRDYMIEQNADMLIGSRFLEKEGFQSTGMRRFGIRYFSALIKLLTGQKITDPTSGMRMINRDILAMYSESYPKDYPEPESVVAIINSGKKVMEYPVIMRKRMEGTSSISPLKSIYYMIKVSFAIFLEMLRK